MAKRSILERLLQKSSKKAGKKIKKVKPKRKRGVEPLLKAMGVIAPTRKRVKRRPTPQQIQQFQRIKQLQRQQRGSNLNPKAVYRRFLEDKQRELEMRQLKETKLSPNTQLQLERIARIQNMSKVADARNQRRKREREILGKSMSLLATPFIFKETFIDPTREVEGNPLRAENVFKERPDNPSILKTRSEGIRTILDLAPENNIMIKKRVEFEND